MIEYLTGFGGGIYCSIGFYYSRQIGKDLNPNSKIETFLTLLMLVLNIFLWPVFWVLGHLGGK